VWRTNKTGRHLADVHQSGILQANIDEWKQGRKLGNRGGYHPDRDKVFAWRAEVAQRLSEMKKVAFPSAG